MTWKPQPVNIHCPACDARLGARKVFINHLWWCGTKCARDAPMLVTPEEKEPAMELPKIDNEDALLALLIRSLRDADNASVEEALERLYPSYRDMGWAQCLCCLDTGVICTQCELNPHTQECYTLKGIQDVKLCDARNCEAKPLGDIRRELEVRKLKSDIESKDKELTDMKARFSALSKLRQSVTANRMPCQDHRVSRSSPICPNCRATW